ncbi:PIG-L family deacetylase [Alteromonas sp. K632G]|jgi:LmbE family N-acetylglucosaminyl deacetylase|uniref:PIG-L deacetylase family protein n=1 Tax=Alteromonas sp. K632G TaxID=2820757 RepID=UPI001AD695E6|nr:PIG-L family deacetylase [Alteromonas sp. K632G]MBO7920747.1 PIG-L family deacetylase [Alteromonas sp. K632G]
MNKKVVVFAPHPDDESLGCGGTLLKHKSLGHEVHWCIVTDMSASDAYTQEQKKQRVNTVEQVAKLYEFDSVINLGFQPAGLDNVPMGQLLNALKDTLESIKPDTLYLPYAFDVHSDHKVVYQAIISVTKTFRAPYVSSIICYETLSETDYGLSPLNTQFQPNMYVDTSEYIEQKHQILKCYESEMQTHPFPRSFKAVEALEVLRGSQAFVDAAEAFVILRQRW